MKYIFPCFSPTALSIVMQALIDIQTTLQIDRSPNAT